MSVSLSQPTEIVRAHSDCLPVGIDDRCRLHRFGRNCFKFTSSNEMSASWPVPRARVTRASGRGESSLGFFRLVLPLLRIDHSENNIRDHKCAEVMRSCSVRGEGGHILSRFFEETGIL
jgi:hypothetical protein